MALFNLPDPDRFGTVTVIDQLVINRILTGCPMMMEDVPLDTARNPGPEHSDIRRFDNVLTIEDFVSVRLVRGVKQPSADVGEHANLQVVVFKIQGPIYGIGLDIGRIVIHRIGINPTFGTLIGKIPFKKRRFLGRIHPISRNGEGSLPQFHRSVLSWNRTTDKK